MFQIVILICSIGLAPSECQNKTALDVFRGPKVATELMCGLHGQAYLARTSLAARSEGEYVKIRCVRSPGTRDTLRPAGRELRDRLQNSRGVGSH